MHNKCSIQHFLSRNRKLQCRGPSEHLSSSFQQLHPSLWDPEGWPHQNPPREDSELQILCWNAKKKKKIHSNTVKVQVAHISNTDCNSEPLQLKKDGRKLEKAQSSMTKTQNYSHMSENKDLSSVLQHEEKNRIKNQLLSEQLQVKCKVKPTLKSYKYLDCSPPSSFYYPEIVLMYRN